MCLWSHHLSGKTIGRTARVILGAAVAPPLSLLIMLIALRLSPGSEITMHEPAAGGNEVPFFLVFFMIGSLVAYGAVFVFGGIGYMVLSESMKSDPRAIAGLGAVAGICTVMVISYELGILSSPVVLWLALFGLVTGGLTGWLFWMIGLRGAR